jgi:flagellar hook-basal body complex protein FliE
MANVISAVQAYNRAISANKNVVRSPDEQQKLNILRQGDDLQVFNNKPSAAVTFPAVLDEVILNQTNKIKEGAREAKKILAISPSNEPLGTDLVELVSSVNETETTLLAIVAIKDRVIEAYKTVMQSSL